MRVHTLVLALLELQVLGSRADFYFSQDAGSSWERVNSIPGQFASSVECAPGTLKCWSTLLDVDTQISSLAYAESTA